MIYAGTLQACNSSKDAAAIENPEQVQTFCSLLNGTLTGKTYVGSVLNLKTSVGGKDSKNDYELVRSMVGVSFDQSIAYMLSDGSIVAFSRNAYNCELPVGQKLNSAWIASHLKCLGFIDVNGTSLPNKEVVCSDKNKTSIMVEKPCIVKNNANDMTDIYPVVFHDSTVEPGSNAAAYVLHTSK